jgi:hypothetical protein
MLVLQQPSATPADQPKRRRGHPKRAKAKAKVAGLSAAAAAGASTDSIRDDNVPHALPAAKVLNRPVAGAGQDLEVPTAAQHPYPVSLEAGRPSVPRITGEQVRYVLVPRESSHEAAYASLEALSQRPRRISPSSARTR